MVALHLFINADGMLKDVPRENIIEAKKDIRLGVLDHGMHSGKPSVSFGIELPDGKVVFAETSLLLLQSAVRAFTARYGDMTREN